MNKRTGQPVRFLCSYLTVFFNTCNSKGTPKLGFERIVDTNKGMQPPQSADFPKALYTLPGVMIVRGSAFLIHSIAE